MPDVRLRTTFRYIHEPLQVDEDAVPLLGNEAFVDELKQRLRKSRGGTFLVTGFRGVGKSTVVARALHEIERNGERRRCMVCETELGQYPTHYPATCPKLGDLVLDDGRELPLDDSYVFGSDPGDDTDVRTVKVDGTDVQHLAIQLDGWHIYAHDLDSASGTTIRFAGSNEFQNIPPGATVSLHPGMSIRLAGQTTITYRGRNP